MTLLPKESSIVFALNLDRLRGSKVWANVQEYRNDPSSKKDYDEFVQKTGLDPLTQVTMVLGGVPSDVDTSHEMAVVIKGKFDEQKLVAYAREKQKTDPNHPGEIKSESYGGKTIYSSDDQMGFVFLDGTTFALAGKNWVKKVIDLAAGKGESVKRNDAVQALVKKTKTQAALWGVGQVPPGKAALDTGGELKSIAGNADFGSGLAVDVFAEAQSADQAKKLTEDTQKKIEEIKKNPMLAMTGMGGLIESMKVMSEGASMHVTVNMNQQQTDELANRLKGLVKMFQGMGGMGGGLGGIGGPGAMPPGMGPGPGGMPPGMGAPGAMPDLPKLQPPGTSKPAGGKKHK